MSGLGRVSATDVVRSLGNVEAPNVGSIKRWLEKEYLGKAGGGFSYDPAINGLADVLKGIRPFEDARERVGASGRPFGRPFNVAVFDALRTFADGHRGQAHKLRYVAVKIGRHRDLDIHVGLKVPLVRVEGGRPRLVIPAFRNTNIPTKSQAALECSIALAFLAEGDFYGVDEFEYLCVRSAGSALKRECQVLTRSDLPLLSADRVNELLTLYLRAVVELIDEGKGGKPSRMGGYQVIDPNGPDAGDLFR